LEGLLDDGREIMDSGEELGRRNAERINNDIDYS